MGLDLDGLQSDAQCSGLKVAINFELSGYTCSRRHFQMPDLTKAIIS